MAMIKCSECGKEISNKATSCINCGCPIEKTKKKVIVLGDKDIYRCTVHIDNQSVGEIGSIVKKERIEIELPIGIHYIKVGLNGDGKQFEITENDEIVEIELAIKTKQWLSHVDYSFVIGNIGKYTESEYQIIEKERIAVSEIREKETKKLIWSFLLGIVVIGIIIFCNAQDNSLTGVNREIYKFIKENGYGSTGGGDIRYGFSVFSKDDEYVGWFNMEFEKVDRTPKYTYNEKYSIEERKINQKLGHYD